MFVFLCCPSTEAHDYQLCERWWWGRCEQPMDVLQVVPHLLWQLGCRQLSTSGHGAARRGHLVTQSLSFQDAPPPILAGQ